MTRKTGLFVTDNSAITGYNSINVGFKDTTIKGDTETLGFYQWSDYPKSTVDASMSENDYISNEINNTWSPLLDFEPDLNREIILYNPIVGTRNQQNIYEMTFPGAETSYSNIIYARGIYPSYLDSIDTGAFGILPLSGEHDNLGASIPWSINSPVISNDDVQALQLYTNPLDSVFNTSLRYENGPSTVGDLWAFVGGPSNMQVPMYHERVVDGLTVDPEEPWYGGYWRSMWGPGQSASLGYGTQWINPEPDPVEGNVILTVDLNQSKRPVDDYKTKTIRIAPATNLRDFNGQPDVNHVKVNSLKDVLYKAFDESGNLIDRRVIQFQEWQATDYVIYYKELQSIAKIELMVLSVWDEGYGFPIQNGGISEIYWYLDFDDGVTPRPCTVEIEQANINGEDSIRFKSKKSPTFIDSGDFFVNSNMQEIGLNGISGGIYVGVSKNDRKTNEKYDMGSSIQVKGTNGHFSSEITQEMRDQLVTESEEARQEQLIIMGLSIMLVASIIAAVVTFGQTLWGSLSLSGLITALGAATVSGVTAGLKMGIIYTIFVTGFTFMNMFLPTIAPYVSMIFDSIDATVSFITNVFCHLLDVPIQWFIPGFETIRIIGPLVFGIYSFTFDLAGTLPRWLTVNHMNAYHPQELDWRHVIFEKYEIDMMEGTYYDWTKYESAMGVG